MTFDLDKYIAILERTPDVVSQLLQNLPDDWVQHNEGPDTWSPFDIVGHLIHGEKTDWIPRAEIILSDSGNKTFEAFDRFAQFEASKGKSMEDLLDEFRSLRKLNLERLKRLNIQSDDLKQTGMHPGLGEVNLQQLLSTWVVHDLGHIAQISRVMAKQLASEVGPWQAYLGILHQ